MKINVGDYIRTKDGVIAKLEDVDKEFDFFTFDTYVYKVYQDSFDMITLDRLKEIVKKTSPNIVDLIENGDYVNGYLVTTGSQGVGSIYIAEIDGLGLKKKLYEKDIESIVTKEQFEKIKYKI